MDMLHGTNIYLENKPISKHFFIYIWIMYATVHMTKNCFGSAMAAIVAEGALTKSQTGLIMALFYLFYAPLQIPGGVLADKYNPERFILVGLIGAAAVNIIIFVNHNFYVMLFAWVFNAIIQAPLWPSAFKIISSQLAASDRPRMIFYISFSDSFGFLMGYTLAAFIPSWEYNFAISAAVLAILAICMYGLCIRYGNYTSVPRIEQRTKTHEWQKSSAPTWKLFAASGFFMVLPAIVLRSMVELGTTTLSPTMLMESYANVSPSIGNLLNIFIILSGPLGIALVKIILYPKLIKNELKGICIMLIAALPFTIILRFLGIITVSGAVVALCGITITTTATRLLLSHYTMRFASYGKNATAEGLSNAALCLGIMFESYGFVHIADLFGWSTVTTMWIVMIAVAALFTALAIPFSKRFKRCLQNNTDRL